jgi:hypothetical protein
MDFLDISSLGATYRYVIKIEHKFKQWNKREFGSANIPQHKYGKGGLTHRTRDKVGRSNHKTTIPSHRKRRVMISRRRTLENGVSSTRAPGTTLLNVT